jgi:hypothetical protein
VETHVNAIAAKAGIDPQIIAAIIAAITQIFSSCSPKPKPADVLGGGGLKGRIILARAMRENGVRPLSAESHAVHAAMVEQAATMSEADAAEFLSLCQ